MKRIQLLLCGFLLLVGCLRNGEHLSTDLDDVARYRISISKSDNQGPFTLEQYFIPMETTPGSLLGEVKKIISDQNVIFLADNQKIVCYELDDEFSCGNIKYTINRLGKGPGEYRLLYDFAVNNNYVFVYDQIKVYCYEINTGRFAYTINVPFAAREVAASDNHIFFYASSFQNESPRNFEIFVISLDGKSQSQYFEGGDHYLGLLDGYQFYRYQQDVYYASPYRNIVYKFDDKGKPQPFMIFEFDQEGVVFDHAANSSLTNPEGLANGDYYYHFGNFFIHHNFCGVQFGHKGHYYSVWFSSENPNERYISGIHFRPETFHRNFVIMPMDSWYVTEFDPTLFEDNPAALEMYSRVMNVDVNDNPCLLLQKLRN